MNNRRRHILREVIVYLTELKERLDGIREEEDEARENMPENLGSSERYEQSEECSDAIDNAIAYIDEAIGALEEIC